jgi:hypothetical protein
MKSTRLLFVISVGVALVAACSGVDLPDAGLGGQADSAAGSSGGGSGGSSSSSGGGGSSGSTSSSSSGGSSSGAGDGGPAPPAPVACGGGTCASGQTCCGVPARPDAGRDGGREAGPAGSNYGCVATQTSCPAGATSVTACTSGQNCKSGDVCCRLVSGAVTSQTCEITCVAGEAQLCATDGECLSGRVCSATGACVVPAVDSGAEGGRGPDGGPRRDAGPG